MKISEYKEKFQKEDLDAVGFHEEWEYQVYTHRIIACGSIYELLELKEIRDLVNAWGLQELKRIVKRNFLNI